MWARCSVFSLLSLVLLYLLLCFPPEQKKKKKGRGKGWRETDTEGTQPLLVIRDREAGLLDSSSWEQLIGELETTLASLDLEHQSSHRAEGSRSCCRTTINSHQLQKPPMGHNNLLILNVGSWFNDKMLNWTWLYWPWNYIYKSCLWSMSAREQSDTIHNTYTIIDTLIQLRLRGKNWAYKWKIMPRNDQMKPFRCCISYCRAINLPWKCLELRQHISVHLFYHRDCMKEGWSRPVTSIGKLPSSLDRKITLFRENNTLVSAAGAPRQHSLACVCASKSPRCRCQPEYKGSLYMISMHLCKTYWTKKPCPECCSTPINGLRNYFERRLVVRQLWYVAGEAFLLCSVPAMRPGHVLIIQQQEDICLYWVTRPRKAPACIFKSRKMGR